MLYGRKAVGGRKAAAATQPENPQPFCNAAAVIPLAKVQFDATDDHSAAHPDDT